MTEDRDVQEVAKLDALRKAARVGFDDLDEGRFVEIEADAIDDAIASLGKRAPE